MVGHDMVLQDRLFSYVLGQHSVLLVTRVCLQKRFPRPRSRILTLLAVDRGIKFA